MAYKQGTGSSVATQSILTDDPISCASSWNGSFKSSWKQK